MKNEGLILENQGLKVTFLRYGATIASIIDKTLQRELVLGFDVVEKYVLSDKYFGCTVGRVANRIANGRFELNDQLYQLAINNGPHHLHGGQVGFDKKIFDSSHIDNSIEFTYFSPHLEEGYPGNLSISILYTLLENKLFIKTRAVSDMDTLVNLTNHTYFNLNANKHTIADHFLHVSSNRVYPVDEDGCTYNQPFEVSLTPFDFTQERVIKDCLESEHTQVRYALGLDHHFDINGSGFRWALTLSNQDVAVNVYTDKPGVHIYTGNYLSDIDDSAYKRHSGICFETQYVPNSINFDTKIAPIVKAGEIQNHQTLFEFVVRGGKHEH